MMDERCTDGRGHGREESPPFYSGCDTGRTSPAATAGLTSPAGAPGLTSPAATPGRTWAPVTNIQTPRAAMARTPLSTPEWTDQSDQSDQLTYLTSPRDPSWAGSGGSRTTTGLTPAATTKENSWLRYGPKRVIRTAMKYVTWTNSEKKGDGSVVVAQMTGEARSGSRSKVDGRGRAKQERKHQQQPKLPPQKLHQHRSAAEPAERPAAASSPDRSSAPDRTTGTGAAAGECYAAVVAGTPSPPPRHFVRGELGSIDSSERWRGGDIEVAGGDGSGGASSHLLPPGVSPSHRLSADYGGGNGNGGDMAMAGSEICPSSPEVAEEARRRELRAAFDRFDKDQDGFITKEELRDMLRALGDEATDEDLDFMIQEVDKNGDGMIDWEEFVSLNTVDARQRERELHVAFGIFDKDKNGEISAQELYEVLNRLDDNSRITIEEVEEMIKKVDEDGDGVVNFKEFKNMMEIDMSLTNGLSG